MIRCRRNYGYLVIAACLLTISRAAGAEDTPRVSPVIGGADLSLLQYIQNHGIQYRVVGKIKDPLAIFRDHGVSYVRLRLFVNPNGLQGQVNSLPYTLALAKRVKDDRLKFLLDFHYSDEWADPGHQKIPAAWQGLPHAQIVTRVFTYTRDILLAFQHAGCLPDMVQIGNEITNGMIWPDGGSLADAAKWDDFADLVKAGVRGTRAADPKGLIKIMIHIDKGGDLQATKWFFDNLAAHRVDFDIIGQSFYPWWHGSLEALQANLAFMAHTYRKDIIVVETAYDWRPGEDFAGSTPPFPETREGQHDFLEALARVVRNTPDGRGKGIFWWEPAAEGHIAKRALFDDDRNALPAMHAFDLHPTMTQPSR